MTDELDLLTQLRAAVSTPSADAWARARAAWDGSEPHVANIAQDGGRDRTGRALSWRLATALLVSIALTVGVIAVVRERIRSVEPNRTIAGLPLEETGGTAEVFLIVGVDRRAFDDPDVAPIEGVRADAIELVRVDATSDVVTAIAIPRDLFVDVPSTGTTRLAQVFAEAGPQTFVEAVRRALGVAIDHYVEVDFGAFASVVDELGGLRIAFPVAQRDSISGFDQAAGCQVLDGAEALAFVRSRFLEYELDGIWHTDPRSDLGRMQRQQLAMGALADAAAAHMGADPADLVRRLFQLVVVDSGFTADDAFDLFGGLRREDTQLRTTTLPVERHFLNDAEGLLLAPNAQDVVNDVLAGGDAPATAPGPAGASAARC